jgi:uncharacterized membrane protein HdeD (DUF308 family)
MSQFWTLVAVMLAAVPGIIAVVNRVKAQSWAKAAPTWLWFVLPLVLGMAVVAFAVYGAEVAIVRTLAAGLLVGGAAAGVYDVTNSTPPG